MYYVTVQQSPMYRQMTLEEFLFPDKRKSPLINKNETNTRTYEVNFITNRFRDYMDMMALKQKLVDFNTSTAELRARPRQELYRTFYIPKKSGGLRKIDAPNEELMAALRTLKAIFEEDFKASYHTSAFAYVKGRSTIDAVKRHQANESKWFGKFDLSNFFGSTTPEYVDKMFSMIWPFCLLYEMDGGREELLKALDLAFLNGGLPQGTPISPTITNIMMIPVDFKLANGFRDFNRQSFVYTRYADDFLVSSKYDFNVQEVQDFITGTLASFGAPFRINPDKTRYGSSSGSNWNLGVMLNGENKITIGYKKKKQFQAMLTSYILDRQHGTPWQLNDIQTLEGYRNYYRMVEGETIDNLVNKLSMKFGENIVKAIKDDLKA